jgi:hypothetical protein
MHRFTELQGSNQTLLAAWSQSATYDPIIWWCVLNNQTPSATRRQTHTLGQFLAANL